MEIFLRYFIQSSDQVVSILSTTVLWFSLTSLGAWVAGRERVVAADIISGWALVSIILTVGGVLFSVSFTLLFSISSLIVLLSYVFVARREGLWLSIPFLKLIFLAVPFILIASAMQGSQWDEFSDWLAIPRYLFFTDRFPSSENLYPSANTIAYPFNWHFINYLASTISGKFMENIGPLFNVLLLLSFSIGLLNVINRVFDDDKILYKQSWSLIAFVGLATTLFNPTFAQKIVLTSYADTSTAVVTGFAVILSWFTLECLSEGNRRETRNCAFQLSMAFVILINLKQATFAIFGLIVLGFILVAYRDRSIHFLSALKVILITIIPAILIYSLWRYHVAMELSGGEAGLMDFSLWHFKHVPEILLQMLITLLKKGYYLCLVIVILVLAAQAFRLCERPADRLFLLSGFLIGGYNAFLFLIYVSSFGEFDALRVASYWRYNMHMGAVVISAFSVWLVGFWHRFINLHRFWARFSWLPIALLVLAPCIFAKKLRFDLDPMIRHYRSVGVALSNLISANSLYIVLDPKGSGESYNITTYEMNDKGRPGGYLAAYHKIDEQSLKNVLATENLKYLILYSLSPAIKEALSIKLLDDQSQLLQKNDEGWRLISSWQLPAVK